MGDRADGSAGGGAGRYPLTKLKCQLVDEENVGAGGG